MFRKKIKKNNFFYDSRGVSLLEMIVSIALFAITMLVATQIFKMVLDRQRDAIISQDLQEGMRFAFERMGKEIRTAVKDSTGWCNAEPGQVYSVSADGKSLTFINENGLCVTYAFVGGTLNVQRSDVGVSLPIIPRHLNVKRGFFVDTNMTKFVQPKVLVSIELTYNVNGVGEQSIGVQTVLSSRFYE